MATDKHNLIVYCEFEDGKVADVSLELLTKGRQLADRLGIRLEAVVAGDDLKDVEKQILPYGVDTVYKFEDKRLYPYTSLPHSSILINLFKEKEPRIAFMGATSIGRDLGPRVSSALHSGLTADCTQLEIGDHKDARTGEEYKDLLLQIRRLWPGHFLREAVIPHGSRGAWSICSISLFSISTGPSGCLLSGAGIMNSSPIYSISLMLRYVLEWHC